MIPSRSGGMTRATTMRDVIFTVIDSRYRTVLTVTTVTLRSGGMKRATTMRDVTAESPRTRSAFFSSSSSSFSSKTRFRSVAV